MKYEYGNIEDAKAGDVLECTSNEINGFTEGSTN